MVTKRNTFYIISNIKVSNSKYNFQVRFYARSDKYNNDNYLYRFDVWSEQEAIDLAKKFKAKAAWLVSKFGGLQKRIL